MESVNDYIYRGTRPKPMAIPPPKRISSPAGQRLSTIMETQNNANLSPPPTNRRSDQRFNIGTPPRASEEKRPPSYSSQEGAITNAERARFEREPRSLGERLRRRGNWKKLLIIGGVLLVIILALAVGLGVGLSMTVGDDDNNNSEEHKGNAGSGSHSLGPFPAGSWYFDTYLTDVSTDCTSNDQTWTCPPYNDVSEAPFNWIIQSADSGDSAFTISSSSNPLAFGFEKVPLHLRAENTPQEHYTFSSIGIRKAVLPNVPLTGGNVRSICIYNTTLTANIYTRKPATLFSQGAAMAALNGPKIQTWAHAVEIDQFAHGGNNIPKCYKSHDSRPTGPPIKLPSTSPSSSCRCLYQNYDS